MLLVRRQNQADSSTEKVEVWMQDPLFHHLPCVKASMKAERPPLPCTNGSNLQVELQTHM